MSIFLEREIGFSKGVDPVWCPGCGHREVLDALGRALETSGAHPADTVVVTGMGCASLINFYLHAYGLHGVHGRALPLALGVKAANPELRVVVAGGDGDTLGTGVGHLIHAARSGVDLTVLILDNQSYALAGGDPSPTSPRTGKPVLNPLTLLLAAGAPFIAQGVSWRPDHTAALIARALAYPGFSVVRILSPCPTFRPEEEAGSSPPSREIGSEHDIRSLTDAMRIALAAEGRPVGILYEADRAPEKQDNSAPRAGPSDPAMLVDVVMDQFRVSQP